MSSEAANASLSLAQDVLGITDPSDVEGSFTQASQILGHELIPNYRSALALGNLAYELGNRRDWERANDSLGLHGMLQGRIEAANTLTDWPVYLSMLERFGSPAVKGAGAQALMVGSQTATSSRAFERYALTQYNADTARVVDLHGTEAKARHGSFEVGDGLALRFATGSMDFIHTNHLLRWLEDPADPKKVLSEEMARSLLHELVRVLAPGGQLFMHERVPGSDDIEESDKSYIGAQEWQSFIMKELVSLQVDDVVVEKSEAPLSLDFLFDPARDFANRPTKTSRIRLGVFAQKD